MAESSGKRKNPSKSFPDKTPTSGPPLLPGKSKGRSQPNKRDREQSGLSVATICTVIGGGVVLGVILSIYVVFQLQSPVGQEPAPDQVAINDERLESTVGVPPSDAPELASSTEVPTDGSKVLPVATNDEVTAQPKLQPQPQPEAVVVAPTYVPKVFEKSIETTPPSPDTPLPEKSEQEPGVAMKDQPAAEETPDDTTIATGEIDAMIASAASLVKEMKGKGAVMTLKKASNLYPKEIRPDFYLGLLHSGVGINDAKNAEEYFRRVLDRSPKHIPAMNNLAVTYAKARKIPPARNYLTLANQAVPESIEVIQNIGRLLNQAQPLQIKKEELKKITALNASLSGFRSDVGWMYLPLDQSPTSLEEYKSFCIDGQLEDVSCSYCTGKGMVVCPNCIGTGTLEKTTVNSQTFSGPLGSTTTVRQGNATAVCSTCRGQHKVDCPYCQNGHDPALGGRTAAPVQPSLQPIRGRR